MSLTMQALDMVVNTFLEEQKIRLKASEDKEKGMLTAWLRVCEVTGLTMTAQETPVPVNTLCAHISNLVTKASLCDQYQKQISVLQRNCVVKSVALIAAQRLITQSTNTGSNNLLLKGDGLTSLEFDKQQCHTSCHTADPCHKDSITKQPTRQNRLKERLRRLQVNNCASSLSLKSVSQENTFQSVFEEDHALVKQHTYGDSCNTRLAVKQWNEDNVHTSKKAKLELSLHQAMKKLSELGVLREEQAQLPLCSSGQKIRCEAQDESNKLQVSSPDNTTLYETRNRVVVPGCGTDLSTEAVIEAHPAKQDPVKEMQKEELRLLQYEHECREAELKSALKESRTLVEQIRVSHTRAEEIRRTEILANLDSERSENQIILDRCNELQSSIKTFNDLLVEAYNRISVFETSEKEVRSQLSWQESVIEELQVELDKYKTLHSNAQQELVSMRHEQKISFGRQNELQRLALTLKSKLHESRESASILETLCKETQSMAAAELESSRNELKLKLEVARSEWQALLNTKELLVSELQRELGSSQHDQMVALNNGNELSTSVISLESSLLESRKKCSNLQSIFNEAQLMAEVELESSRTEFELKQKMALKQCGEFQDSVIILESSLQKSQTRILELEASSKEAQYMAAADVESSRNELKLKLEVARSEWQALLNTKELLVSELQRELGSSQHDQMVALNNGNELSASVISLESSLLESRKKCSNLQSIFNEAQLMAEVELESSRTEFELKQKMALKQCGEFQDSVRILESSLHKSQTRILELEASSKEAQYMAEAELESSRNEFNWKLTKAKNEFHIALKAKNILEAEVQQEFSMVQHEKDMVLTQCNELHSLAMSLEESLHKSRTKVSHIESVHIEEQHMVAADFESLRNELQCKLKIARSELNIAQNTIKFCVALLWVSLEDGICSRITTHRIEHADLSWINARESKLQADVIMALQRQNNYYDPRKRCSDLHAIVESLTNSLAIEEQNRVEDLEVSCKGTNESHVADKVCCPAILDKYNEDREVHFTQSQLNLIRTELEEEEEERVDHSVVLKRTDEKDMHCSVKVNLEHHLLSRGHMRIPKLEKLCEEAQLHATEYHPSASEYHTVKCTNVDETEGEHSEIESKRLTDDQYCAIYVAQQPQARHILEEEVPNNANKAMLLSDELGVTPYELNRLVHLVDDLYSYLNDAYDKAALKPDISENEHAYMQLSQQDSASEGRLLHQHVSEAQAESSHIHHGNSELRLLGYSSSCSKELQEQQNEEYSAVALQQHSNSNINNNLYACEENLHLETRLTGAHKMALKLLNVVDNNVTQARKLQVSLKEAQNTSMQAQAGQVQSENALATAMLDLEKVKQEYATVLGQIDGLNVSMGTLKENLAAAHNTSLELDALREEAQFRAAGTETALFELNERLHVAQMNNAIILNKNGHLKSLLDCSRSDLVKLQEVHHEEYLKAAKLERMKTTLEEQFCMYKEESASIQQRLIRERIEALDQKNSLTLSVCNLENLLSEASQNISELKTSHKTVSLLAACQESSSPQSRPKEGQCDATQNGHSTTLCLGNSTPHDAQFSSHVYGSTLSFTDSVAETSSFTADKEAKEVEVLQYQTQTQWYPKQVTGISEKDTMEQTCCCSKESVSHGREWVMRNDEPQNDDWQVKDRRQQIFSQDHHFPSENIAKRSYCFSQSEGLNVLNKQQQHQPSDVLMTLNDLDNDISLTKMGTVESSSCSLDGIGPYGDDGKEHTERGISRKAGVINSQVEEIEHSQMTRTDFHLASPFPGLLLDQHVIASSSTDNTQTEVAAAAAAAVPLHEICEKQLKMDVTKGTYRERTESDKNQILHQSNEKGKTAVRQSLKLPGGSSSHSSNIVAERKVLKGILQGTNRTSYGGMNHQSIIPLASSRQPLQEKNDRSRNIRQSSVVDLKVPNYDNSVSINLNKREGIVVVKMENQENCFNLNGPHQVFLAEDNNGMGGGGEPNKSQNSKYKDSKMNNLNGTSKPLVDQQQQQLQSGDGRRIETVAAAKTKNRTNSPTLAFRVNAKREVKHPEACTVRCVANELAMIGQRCVSSRDRRVLLLNMQSLAEEVEVMNGWKHKEGIKSLFHHQQKKNLAQKRKITCLTIDKGNLKPRMVV